MSISGLWENRLRHRRTFTFRKKAANVEFESLFTPGCSRVRQNAKCPTSVPKRYDLKVKRKKLLPDCETCNGRRCATRKRSFCFLFACNKLHINAYDYCTSNAQMHPISANFPSIAVFLLNKMFTQSTIVFCYAKRRKTVVFSIRCRFSITHCLIIFRIVLFLLFASCSRQVLNRKLFSTENFHIQIRIVFRQTIFKCITNIGYTF